ncbi:MAG: tRNA-intron lyase [Methermicoccaceae archaeon]
MQGVWSDGKVRLSSQGAKSLIEAGYGRVKGEVVVLSAVEACYLLHSGRLEVCIDGKSVAFEQLFTIASSAEPSFELRYIVYRDLRERGYSVAVQSDAFRLYQRGMKPAVSASEFFVHVVGERETLTFAHLIQRLDELKSIRKRMAMAVVDEDGALTYYEIKELPLKKKESALPQKASATLLWDRAFVWDEKEARSLHECMYGTPLDDHRLQLSLMEMFYLAQAGVLDVRNSGGVLSADELAQLTSQLDSESRQRLSAYAQLREHGYVPKSGYKFGSHFRMYDTEDSPEHSTYLVHVLSVERRLSPPELSRAVRLAHSVHKRMVFACTDDDIRYIEIGRFRP